MGTKAPQNYVVTPELVEQSCQFIIRHHAEVYTKGEVIKPIKIILQCIREADPIQVVQGSLWVNPSFIRLVFNNSFGKQMMKMVLMFTNLLQDLYKKSLNFLKVGDVNDMTAVADFILYFSNEKIMEAFDSLLVRTDVMEATKSLLKEMRDTQGQLEVNGNLVERINPQVFETIYKTLRVTLMEFIHLRLQMISRSEKTLRYFAYFQQSLFMLYTKLYFSRNEEANIIEMNQQFKSNMVIGAYFLSAGTSCIQPSIYETGMIFLYSFLKMRGVEYREMKELPSHLFKNLPIVPNHSLYEYILCTLLFTLKYVKEGPQTYIRFAFNRIMSLKLVELLLKNQKLHNKTITYYLEQLCLQVKVGQIERACLYEVVQTYSHTALTESPIIKKFLETGNLKYNLKFTDRQIKVSKDELLTELEDDADTCRKEYHIASHKFVLQRIMFRAALYNFNDKLLWSELLPNIINNKEDEEAGNNLEVKDTLEHPKENTKEKEDASGLESPKHDSEPSNKV